MTKEYEVLLPVTGIIITTVKAESEEEAIEKAFEKDYFVNQIYEFDIHEKITRGNVFHGLQNEVLVEEI